jgi:hypothetical protein
MNRIKIIQQGNKFMAHHTGPHAKEVIDLFGTPTIETAFNVPYTCQEVARVLQNLNPNVIVS